MVIFPPVETADEDGFLAWGGDLEPDTLRHAYRSGIFPWPVPGAPLLWFAPPERALLFFDEFHVSRSTRKLLRQQNWETRFDTDFRGVIENCKRAPRPGQGGTWITGAMAKAYTRLHQLGDAHSVEIYLNGELVGGLYGVSFGAYFAGESMFFRESGASKAALIHLVECLKSRGATWLDCQMTTPLFASFGAREVPRHEFMELLNEALHKPDVL
jgi:leucyl/phenylalanyl-tRNA--protein transferase